MNKHPQKAAQVFGIIGESLDHSLSPAIHNHFLRRAGLAATYTTFPVANKDLARAIAGIRTLGIRGVNITNPYKERVIPFLDRLARSAKRIGAVNTIENKRGTLIGHNTDIIGIRAVLQNQLRRALSGKDVVLLGSGGVARSCLIELIGQRVGSITILARAPRKATGVVTAVGKQSSRTPIEIEPWNDLNRVITSARPVLVLNATSASPRETGTILTRLAKAKNSRLPVFLDLNYGRRAVPANHRPRSLRYIDGLYMLAVQAAESFRLWTGHALDPKVVYRYARREIEEN